MNESSWTYPQIVRENTQIEWISTASDMEIYRKFDANGLTGLHNSDFSVSDAISLGEELKRLQILSYQSIQPLGQLSIPEANDNLRNILDSLISIEICLIRFGTNGETLEKISSCRREIAQSYDSPDQDLEVSDVKSLIKDGDRWIDEIETELADIPVFTISSELHLGIKELLNNPSSFFSDDTWEWLDRKPKNDFREACRALAYDSPTASVMLSLRAVEYCLREWYKYDTNREINQRTWGQVIGELEDKYDKSENYPSIISNLDYLREKRNAVSHTENSPSNREAERMLYRIEGTIQEIYEQIEC